MAEAPVTIGEALSLAIRQQEAGRFAQAENIYRQILAVEPHEENAIRLLALCLMQQARWSEALPWWERAVKSHPENAELWFHCGLTQHRLGESEKAIASYQSAVQRRSDYREAWNNLGHVLSASSRVTESLACFRELTQRFPDYAEGWLNLGCVLLDADEIAEALAALARAVRLRPDLPEAYYNLGRAFQLASQPTQSQAAYEQAVRCRPDYHRAWNNLGHLHLTTHQLPAAIRALQRAVELSPASAEYRNNLGLALQEAGLLTEAGECFENVLRMHPDHAEAHNNLGTVQYALGQFAAAEASYRRAIELDPASGPAHNNFAYSLLQRGDWDAGWLEYRWRWDTRHLAPTRPRFSEPEWRGESLAGKTLLVVAEQGLGDTLQFVRYFSLLPRGGRIIFACQPQLLALLREVDGADEIIPLGETPSHFDFYAALLDLPGLLGTRPDNVPCSVPYLVPPAERAMHWRERLASCDGFRIGLNWRGRPGTGIWRLRDVPLEQFSRLAEVPGVRLISLQFGPLAPDERSIASRMGLIEPGDDFDRSHGCFVDSAAVMSQLDLIISSDTSVPHLAGALARPVWVALPLAADWRWMLGREDSPWYPTLRLFRQSARGQWHDVIARMEQALRRQLGR